MPATAVRQRPVSGPLRTERDVIETLHGRVVTVDQIYAACESAGVHTRNQGVDVVHGRRDTRSRRRARGALQTLRRAGRAHRVAEGTWVVDGTLTDNRATHLVLILTGDPSRIELLLANAEQLLHECDEPPALILADPPWGLGINRTGQPTRDNGERTYARNPTHLVGGYRDVDPASYAEFTERWVRAATQILPAGGYLAIITGPGQAARVQVTAEDCELTFLNQIIVPRPFALPTCRRFSHAHSVATILCSGPTSSDTRSFAVPADLPKARRAATTPSTSGATSASTSGAIWSDTRRCCTRLSRPDSSPLSPPDLTTVAGPWQALGVDPFVGGGQTAIAAYETQRRFLGGDINPRALRLTAARLSVEAQPPDA